MKIKVIRNCKSCLFHYYKNIEDDICFENGGCLLFSPVGLKLEDAEIIFNNVPNKPKHSLVIQYD